MDNVNGAKPHFVLVPLMAQGHMIPMVDMARLLASRGATVSFVTTPVNAARIKPVIDDASRAGLPIRFVEFKLPCKEAGVPEGCESFDLLPSVDFYRPFFEAICMLREPLKLFLQETTPRASCMITDYCHWWTSEVAQELNIVRLVFHGPSCFFILSSRNIHHSKVYESVADEHESVVVPGLPQRIEITRAQAPGWFSRWEDIRQKAMEAERTATGFVMNTFQELESEHVALYIESTKKMVLPIGPLSLYNKDTKSKATRGNKSSIEEHQILSWLDSMEPRSVLLVSFGSMVRTRPLQLIEVGCALEASGRPFVWVVKEVEKCAEVEKWMSEGFEERTRARSLIITGWAPQMVILSHGAVGGFVTHCGWNSILEAISPGVPMITWPHFADQFLNEKLVVEVLRIGVAVGIKVPVFRPEEDKVEVERGAIESAIVSDGRRGGRR
ncbi:UDP-glycosyltransferase 73C5-like [Iris pallida]|uniref:Glycosyltransferase n=1 Tax=Iris pallida TaxID=29817 RepID=A0AAX6ECU4_IRIPA|nr:UDP-glycosyltransferase 73C5-like [Iris pallida]